MPTVVQNSWFKETFGVDPATFEKAAGKVLKGITSHPTAQGGTKSKKPTIDEAAVKRGIGGAYTFALEALTIRHGLVNDEITLWRDKSQTLIENMDGDASSASVMILKVVAIVLAVAVPEAGAFAALAKGASIATSAVQSRNDAAASDDAAQLKEAGQAIRVFADKAVQANGSVIKKIPQVLKDTLNGLKDQDSLERLARGAIEDLQVISERIGVKYKMADITSETRKLRKSLEHEMRTWLKEAARKKATNEINNRTLIDTDSKNIAEKVKKRKQDWETQWSTDYEDKVGSKLDDAYLEEAEAGQ